MKILVFDDSEIHRKTAKLTLQGHNLTIVGTYDEAQAALDAICDHKKKRSILPNLLEKAGLPVDFDRYGKHADATSADKQKYEEVCEAARKLATSYPDFDVVMTDLLVPASAQGMGGEGNQYIGKEMPLGPIIALLALAQGIKNVAVVTDKSHHHHPGSAAFDCFEGGRTENINLLCTNYVRSSVYVDTATGKVVTEEFLATPEGKKNYPVIDGKVWGGRKGITTLQGKDWGSVLETLLGSKGAATTPGA